jgi:hypothetical protein
MVMTDGWQGIGDLEKRVEWEEGDEEGKAERDRRAGTPLGERREEV